MEKEDALGISRRKRSALAVSPKMYRIMRLCLILAIPLVYFLCSPLLIVVMAVWIFFLFVSNAVEKDMNAGLKSDLCTKIPKTDCILSILAVALAFICVVVSSISMASKSGVFDGMTSSQISSHAGGNLSTAEFVWMQIWQKLKSFGSLMTGTRYLFQSEMAFRGGGGDDFSPPAGGSGSLSDMLSDMPFSMVFESVIKAVCTALLVAICVVGVISLYKMWKIQKEMPALTESERIRRLKAAESAMAKRNAERTYFSVKKAEFTDLERELIADLDFLFDPDDESEEAPQGSDTAADGTQNAPFPAPPPEEEKPTPL